MFPGADCHFRAALANQFPTRGGRRSRYWCGLGIGHSRSGMVTLSEDKSTSTAAFHVWETKKTAVQRFTGQVERSNFS